MTRADFIAKWRNELCGVVADAAISGKSGTMLAMFLREAFRKIDSDLGKAWDDLQPKAMPAQIKNGQPART